MNQALCLATWNTEKRIQLLNNTQFSTMFQGEELPKEEFICCEEAGQWEEKSTDSDVWILSPLSTGMRRRNLRHLFDALKEETLINFSFPAV